MVINVHGGHNAKAPGASGLLDEVAEDRKVKDLVIARLRALGHTCLLYTSPSPRDRG